MADFDIQIKNGTIVDGTRVPRYRGDLWIRDGKVAQMGGRAPGFAKKVIDADGLIVAPGFVTVLLFSFVGTWNNYFLPLLVLSKPDFYPRLNRLADRLYSGFNDILRRRKIKAVVQGLGAAVMMVLGLIASMFNPGRYADEPGADNEA